MNLLTMFARARANLSLTPAERSLLKLVENLALTFVVAVCTQVSALASTGGFSFDHNTLLLLAGSGALSVLSALHKLSSASGDPLLGAVVSAVEGEVGKYIPLHQQFAPSAAPASAPASAPAAPAAPAPTAPADVSAPASAI